MHKMNFNLYSVIRKFRITTLIVSVIAFIVGLLLVISPIVSATYLVWILIALTGIAGLIAVIKFIFPGKGNKRNGLSLAIGIIVLLLVAVALICGWFAEGVNIQGIEITGAEIIAFRVLMFFTIFFGICETINSIVALCTIGYVEPGMKGFAVAKSILGILVGIALVTIPFFALTVVLIINGIFMMILSIFYIVMDIKFWHDAKKACKELNEKE